MNEGLDDMSMMDFLTFGLVPLQIVFIAGLFGCGWEGMRWAERRYGFASAGAGMLAAGAWFWAWILVAGAIRLAAWVVS